MAKHTLPPWHCEDPNDHRLMAGDGYLIVYDAEYERVVAQVPIRSNTSSPEEEANVRLVAVAPKLLAAAEAALPWVDDQGGSAAEALRAAIAEAKNEHDPEPMELS